MKLSRLYSNRPDEFGPIEFAPGLNVVLAEIRLPENRDKDTHNLGKSLLGRMIDFCLLADRNSEFFLFRHLDRFKGYVFYLEIELEGGSYLTVRRGVDQASKIAFKKHPGRHQELSSMPDKGWDHFDVPFDRARELLDSLLDLRALKPYTFRKALGYLLRSQDDFRDVFHIHKFAQGRHSSWKPFVALVLGFDAALIAARYVKEDELQKHQEKADAVEAELGGSVRDLSKIAGRLLLAQQEAERKQKLLDAFDLRPHDKEETKELIEVLDQEIADLNMRRYSLGTSKKRIQVSLEEGQILFDPDDAKRVFAESGVLFTGQIKKDFEQLLAFNRALSEERDQYLAEELREVEEELKGINARLNTLGKRRSEVLSFLGSADVFQKYKQASDEMVGLRAEIAGLERSRDFVHQLQALRADARILEDQVLQLRDRIETDVEEKNSDRDSLFSTVRLYFNEIVESVIDRKALIDVSLNSQGHPEFKAGLLDESGELTSAGEGHTYRKLLCVAFDLAVLRAHLGDAFPRFVYHDGVFESLDDRKKENLLAVIRQYADLGIQPIITLIDSDLPARLPTDEPVFEDSEIVLLLHDENDGGRLFRGAPW